eukprot:15482861-Alexandrium_andersonii.AAC.1
MAPLILSCGVHLLPSMMRPKATYGAPWISSMKQSLWPPLQKPGTTSKMTTGGRTSRTSRAAVLHRSGGSAPARPRPAGE